MEIDFLQLHLIIINIAAFTIHAIDFRIHRRGGKGIKPKVICNTVRVFGGALGTFIIKKELRPINQRIDFIQRE